MQTWKCGKMQWRPGRTNDKGQLTDDHRGNLQLSIISRSLQSYYLYQKNNKVQPKQFIGNKVAGILFENKIDHTTYFDPNIEAIQGIHMIPILPSTPYVRPKQFVQEEWEAYFDKGRIDDINNAWKGIIYANYATVNPKKAWDLFTSRDFNPQWLDGGASLTWYMAYTAGTLNFLCPTKANYFVRSSGWVLKRGLVCFSKGVFNIWTGEFIRDLWERHSNALTNTQIEP